MPKVRLIFSFLLLSSFTCAIADDYDVIHTRNHRTYSLPFYRVPVPSVVLPFGKGEYSFAYSNANDFRELYMASGKFSIEDSETQILALSYRRGIGKGWEISAELPYLARGGGFMDPIIDWWHENFLQWSDKVRNKRPFGRSIVRFTDSDIFGSASGIGDLSITARKELPRGLQASIGIKAPTGEDSKLLGSGAWDAGISISKRWQLPRRMTATAQLGAVYQGVSDELKPARRFVHQEMLSFGYHANSRDTYVLQWQGEASALELGISRSDQTQRLMTFGLVRKMSVRDTMEFYFSEDRDLLNGKVPQVVSIGPDFTFGIRWSRRF